MDCDSGRWCNTEVCAGPEYTNVRAGENDSRFHEDSGRDKRLRNDSGHTTHSGAPTNWIHTSKPFLYRVQITVETTRD